MIIKIRTLSTEVNFKTNKQASYRLHGLIVLHLDSHLLLKEARQIQT